MHVGVPVAAFTSMEGGFLNAHCVPERGLMQRD